ncbi:hypothetical protein G6F42_027983 [Rhizopus arrhizus]|nr:hypothetical protein G6F42_027983 [Rhizopus arrhizus]
MAIYNLAAEDNESRATAQAQAAAQAQAQALAAAQAASQSLASAHVTPPTSDYQHQSFSPTPITPIISSTPMLEQTSNDRLSFDSQSNRTSMHSAAGGDDAAEIKLRLLRLQQKFGFVKPEVSCLYLYSVMRGI